MIAEFFVHDASGKILRYGSCPQSMVGAQAEAGETVREGTADPGSQYWDGTQLADRPPMPSSIDKLTAVADGVDVVTISGLPNPTDVRITGPAFDAFEVTDGTLELTFDPPGKYTVRLSSFPYLDQEYVINAT